MEPTCQYDLFSRNSVFDFTAVLSFLDTDPEKSSPCSLSPVSCTSSSPTRGIETTGQWKSLEHDICLILQRNFPSTTLDDIRNTQRHDFYTNGIDLELDEFDHYQVHLRSSPPSYASATKRTNVQPRALKKSEHEIHPRAENKVWRNTVCVFCKNNGETLSVYGTHLLRDFAGRVTCPVLRRYTCPICGVSGDAAHTVKYCPLNTKSL